MRSHRNEWRKVALEKLKISPPSYGRDSFVAIIICLGLITAASTKRSIGLLVSHCESLARESYLCSFSEIVTIYFATILFINFTYRLVSDRGTLLRLAIRIIFCGELYNEHLRRFPERDFYDF